MRLFLSSCVVAVGGLIAGSALGVVVAPGAGPISTPGTAAFAPGVSVADDLVPFTIYVSGSSGPAYFQGNIQRSVTRMASGDLAFSFRIRDTVGGLNGIVRTVKQSGMAGFITDCDFDTTSLGARSPQFVSRTADGSTLTWDWSTAQFSGPIDSKYQLTKTNARHFALSATIQIMTTTGQSATVPMYAPVDDTTPPTAIITGPSPLSCVCNPATITGTATDPDGTFTSFTLEYASIGGGAYTTITTSTTPVIGGTLGVWNTTGVPEGYYFVRLMVNNAGGLSTETQTIIFVDQQFDTVDVRSPVAAGLYGGTLCFDGSVLDPCFDHYMVEYASLPAGFPFNAVDPAHPTFTSGVSNDPLGSWSTRTGPTAVADGNYRVRVIGTDRCGHTLAVQRDVTVDNTAPVAVINSPISCGYVHGVVTITGTASDAHLAGWTLQYTGGTVHGWVTIASGNTSVVNGVLANWNTAGLASCAYTVRLIVSDGASVNCGSTTNSNEYEISLNVGCQADFNRDGAIAVQDIFDYLAAWFAGCP